MIFLSCENKDFTIIDTKVEISEVKTYSLSSTTEESEKNMRPFDLVENYPNLSLSAKLTNPSVEIVKFELINPDKTLIWNIESPKLTIDQHQYIGSNTINLVSPFYDEGTYTIKLYSEDGLSVESDVFIENKLSTDSRLFIYLNNDSLIFSNSKNINVDFIPTLTESNTSTPIQIIYYNKNKEEINSTNYNNMFKNQSYPFELKIDNFEQVYFIEIKVKDDENLQKNIKVDLSSSHSFF